MNKKKYGLMGNGDFDYDECCSPKLAILNKPQITVFQPNKSKAK